MFSSGQHNEKICFAICQKNVFIHCQRTIIILASKTLTWPEWADFVICSSYIWQQLHKIRSIRVIICDVLLHLSLCILRVNVSAAAVILETFNGEYNCNCIDIFKT